MTFKLKLWFDEFCMKVWTKEQWLVAVPVGASLPGGFRKENRIRNRQYVTTPHLTHGLHALTVTLMVNNHFFKVCTY